MVDRVDGWHEFYVAAEGAAATLTGLVFVALSLHLRHVLSRPQLHQRFGSAYTYVFTPTNTSFPSIWMPDRWLPWVEATTSVLPLALGVGV